MTRNISSLCHNDSVDLQGCLYLELNFAKVSLFRRYSNNDNFIGVKTTTFNNLSINDIVTFYSVEYEGSEIR